MFWLALMVILNAFSRSMGALVLLALSIIIPMVFIVLNIILPSRTSYSFSCKSLVNKGRPVQGIFRVKNNTFFPYSKGTAVVNFSNMLTGEKYESKISFPLAIKQTVDFALLYNSFYCGKINVFLSEIRMYDIFGLTYKKDKSDVTGSSTIYPDVFSPQVIIVPAEREFDESVTYSTSKAGYDFSEIFGIKDYTAGDSIKSIHWKLSEKLDKTMIKEAGLPVQNSIILLFETGYPAERPPSAEMFDAIATAYISLSQSLILSEITHSIAWYNQNDNVLECYEIKYEEDLAGILPRVLSASSSQDKYSCVDHYLSVNGSFEFAHIVYVSSYDCGDSLIDSSAVFTSIVCSENIINSDMNRNFSFNPTNITEELSVVHI